MEPWNNFERELHDSGAHIAGEGLRPSTEATTVKLVERGDPLVTDGPFAETKEQLGGFYLIDVDERRRGARVGEEGADAARIGRSRSGR